MDMYNILKNFDDAASGKKPSSVTGDANSMKAILESLNKVTAVEECGMPMASPNMGMQQGSPVSMNVSLNASGKDNVDELMALLKGAGLAAEPKMGPSEPMDMGAMRALVMNPSDDSEMDDEPETEEWDNSPDEEYSDHETMTKDLSGGINRQKKQFKPAATGDNPMAVEGAPDLSPKFIKHLQVTFSDKEMLSRSETRKVENMLNKLSIENIKTLVRANIPHVSDMAKQYMRNNTPGGMKNYGEDMVESVKDRLWAALNEKKTTEGKYKSDAQRKAIHAAKKEKK